MEGRPEDIQATFAATLVDEWVRCGVVHAVVAPGSRSTPMALALAEHPGMAVHLHHDERSAGFLALGIALAVAAPVVVLTTSGTAAAELHPAVVEADLARVPLLVCTADRPPELQDVGAPQAIDQDHLYGRAVRWFHAPGVPDSAASDRWRGMALRAASAARGPEPGPVHLNLAFREPLLGTPRPLPPSSPGLGTRWSHRAPAQIITGRALTLVDELVGRRGVIVAGPESGPGRPIDELARALGWPVLAAPQAPVWGVPGAVIPCADAVLRNTWLGDLLRPEVVVRLGMPVASKVVGSWIAQSAADEVVVAGAGRWVDPAGTADVVLAVEPAAVTVGWATAASAAEPVDGGAWLAAWQQAGATARLAVDHAIDAEAGPTEPGIARDLVEALPYGSELVVSSSMPVRDLEWFARPSGGVRVYANRGANGIDGVVSTAVGVAVGSGRPTALLIGDVALLHDSNGLLGAAGRGCDLVVVVVDNDGGGIFSFLPQADLLDQERFEALFGTPHGLDLVALARAYGVHAEVVDDVAAAVPKALAERGVHVLVVRTDRAANVAVHERIQAAVVEALGDQV
jgi:2-succinyl-5-enolpyruvyl-6-hydroxy-3-cyclohexene-1-carboxylate synthase